MFPALILQQGTGAALAAQAEERRNPKNCFLIRLCELWFLVLSLTIYTPRSSPQEDDVDTLAGC